MKLKNKLNLKTLCTLFLGSWLMLFIGAYTYPNPPWLGDEVTTELQTSPVEHHFWGNLLPHLFSRSQSDDSPGKIVVGGKFTLEKDHTLHGGLVVLGGSVTIEAGSIVEGDILHLGGKTLVDGKVEGAILVLGGKIVIGENAQVAGNLTKLGGSLVRETGSKVGGIEIYTLPLPGIPGVPTEFLRRLFDFGVNPLWHLFWLLIRSFLWAAVAVLVTLFFPNHSLWISKVLSRSTFASAGTGCLTLLVAPIFLFILTITIIGIPISLLSALLLLLMWGFGVIAAGLEVGNRLTQAMRQDWALPVSAAVGIFILTLVMNTISDFIPCFGWIFPALIGAVGIGGVILTRFGTKAYPPFTSEVKSPVNSGEDTPNAE